MTVRVVLVDDHPVFRIGMAALLDSLDGVRVVGQAAPAREVLLLGGEVDVVVMDLDLGDIGPSVAHRAMSSVLDGRSAVRVPFPQLTEREHEVLDLVAAGHDNVVISRPLGLSAKTVRNHVANVPTKLAVPDRSAAIVRARAEGLGGGV
ncbi:response regulator transcription factor [Cellulomonas hominis]